MIFFLASSDRDRSLTAVRKMRAMKVMRVMRMEVEDKTHFNTA